MEGIQLRFSPQSFQSNWREAMRRFALRSRSVAVDGGALIPSLTSTERDALTPENGTVIYNSTTDKFQGRAGGSWVDLH